MANRLKKMLTEEMVRLDPPLLSTPEEVIEYCGNILVENKKAKAGYVKEMIDSYQRFGPYMVMAPGLALPHARPGGNVKEPCISFVKLKEPVCFHHPCNDPVWVVFALGGVSDDGHIELLQDLSSLLAGERMIEKLAALNIHFQPDKRPVLHGSAQAWSVLNQSALFYIFHTILTALLRNNIFRNHEAVRQSLPFRCLPRNA